MDKPLPLHIRFLTIFPSCRTISALYALHFSLSLSFYSGEKLSLVVSSQQELIKSMLSHVKEGAKLAVLNKIMIDDLIGNSTENFSDFGGIIVDEDSLLADAKARNNKLLVEGVHLRRFMSAFWSGGKIFASES